MIPLNEKNKFVVVAVIWKKKKEKKRRSTNHKLNAKIKRREEKE